jgi:hypothetical protein
MTRTVGRFHQRAEALLNDDNAGKPVGIHLMTGRRPYAAFGNSSGDRQMREYTNAGDGMRLVMLVLHDDRKRELVSAFRWTVLIHIAATSPGFRHARTAATAPTSTMCMRTGPSRDRDSGRRERSQSV